MAGWRKGHFGPLTDVVVPARQLVHSLKHLAVDGGSEAAIFDGVDEDEVKSTETRVVGRRTPCGAGLKL